MVIVLKKGVSEVQKQNLKDFLSERNFKTNEVKGEEDTVLAAVGKGAIDIHEVEMQDGVSSVIPISKPYKMASREFKNENTIVEIPNRRGQIIRIGGSRLVTIAGPCLVESREQILEIASTVARSGAVILQGSAFQPRTSPYSFQGLGEKGLDYLREAGDKYGLPVATEIVSTDHISLMKDRVDLFVIGKRNMQNYDLLKKVAALGKPVILKRALSATIEDFLMSAEYLLSGGTDKVILCEGGIRTFENTTRFTLDLSSVPVLHSLTHLPVIVDPSNAEGVRDKVSPMALASVACGADGVIVQVHNHPEKALSAGGQSLLPVQFDKLMHDIEALAPVAGRAVEHIRVLKEESSSSESKKSKNEKVICAYSGKKGAYAEQAISRYFDERDVEAMAVDSFTEIFQAVQDGRAEYGMVPIENSLAGSIFQNYDNLTRFEDVSIVGAVTLNIRHALLGIKGSSIEQIKTLHSHPQGFNQCQVFLSRHKEWTHIDEVSTASAAKFVAEKKNPCDAAIASTVNAALYGLDVLQEDIEDDPSNFTRFVVIAANNTVCSTLNVRSNMVSFTFKTHNEPGALYNCLGVFEKLNLNLTRLESRPVKGESWRYWFYADAEIRDINGDAQDYVGRVMEDLKKIAEDVRLLGIYSEARR